MSGDATITYPDGSIYSWQIRDDKRIWKRTLTFPDWDQRMWEYDAEGECQRVVPYIDDLTDNILDNQKGIRIFDLPHNRDRVGQFVNGKKMWWRIIPGRTGEKREWQYQNGKRTWNREAKSPYKDVIKAEYRDGKLVSSKFYPHKDEF